jgi:uncharacterized protein
VRFWDTSALVPLFLEQPVSEKVRVLLEEDRAIAVWWGASVECWSAFARLRRDGRITAEEEDVAAGVLERLRASFFEIFPGEEVRRRAQRLLRLHPLRAADALQLAAALTWADSTAGGEMVVFDKRLADAARLEGLNPVPSDAME